MIQISVKDGQLCVAQSNDGRCWFFTSTEVRVLKALIKDTESRSLPIQWIREGMSGSLIDAKAVVDFVRDTCTQTKPIYAASPEAWEFATKIAVNP